MIAILIKPDGTETKIAPKNGKDFQLEELYKLIGCELIEVVYHIKGKGLIMIVDEEGKLKPNSQPNLQATKYLEFSDTIVGNAVICQKSMFK